MNVRSFWISIPLVFLSLIYGNVQAAEDSRDALKGLKGVRVVVEDINEGVQDGLTKDAIRTDVELKLRRAGIPVLSEEEWNKEPGKPLLHIWAFVRQLEGVGYLYRIDVKLVQKVTLVRSPSVQTWGETWSVGSLNVIPKLKEIRDRIKDSVDDFVSAYLSVNPKK